MSVWFAVPSKREPAVAEATLKLWRERGYKIALWRDPDDPVPPRWNCLIHQSYPGYSRAVNGLVKEILHYDWKASWIVTGGDDVEPDPNKSAEEIAGECEAHFGMLRDPLWKPEERPPFRPEPFNSATFGVMQPTGDRWGEDHPDNLQLYPTEPAFIDRVCGSPWMGRSFCQRINKGGGPMWPEYFHMYNDEELQAVAKKYGVFWQRRDLTHKHNHWMRDGGAMPEFLWRANGKENYDAMRQIFRARKAAGFPGSEPV